jgi:hypothetical protein
VLNAGIAAHTSRRMKNEPSSNEPSSKPRHQSSTYRPLPPREYALGSEIRRADASFAPTLLSSSSLRRSTTGSQYSWSSRGSGSHRSAGGRTTGQIQQAGLEGRGGGLSSVSISMIPGENNSEVSPVNSAAHVSEQQQQQQDSNANTETADPPQSSHQLSPQHEQDASAMGRISEHDETDTSGISSLKHNLRESEDNVEIFERSDMFGRSLSDSIGYQRNSGDSSGSSLLPSSPNPGISPYEAAEEEESPVPVGEREKHMVNSSEMLTSLFRSDDERAFQQQNKRLPQDQLPNPNSRLKHEVTATPQATNALPTITDIKSPSSVSTMDSESYHPEMAATARFGRLLQQCRALTETCEDSTVDESDRIGSSARSEQKDVVAAVAAALPPFEPAKLKLNSEIQTSGRVYNASEITMDPYIKSEFESRERQIKERKSFVSELSLGVDRMYNDHTEADYTENKMVRSYSRGSHMSELSYSDRRGDEALAKLTVNPNAKSADENQKESSRPDFMRYLSNVSEKDDDDRRSWLSYTDDERTPRNNTQTKQMIRTYKVPVSDKPQFQSNFRRRMADSGTATPQQSPQSSFYSTDFSDEGTDGLLVGFGKRRKSSSNSESSSSSSGFTDSSGSTDDSDSSGSSSSSESEEETEESEPSMPTIARRGLRLTHLNDDDVSALSFGGASALVASAPPKVPLGTPANLLPEGNSRSRLSETSSTPTKSLDKSLEEKTESSPESEESKRSGKSSGSDLLSAGGRPRRRSSLTGAENLSEFGSVGPSAVQPRRATIGDLPQLEEESSQASSTSPSPEAPTTACDTITSRTASYDETSPKAPSRRSSKSSKSASFNSKRDVPTQNENTSTTENTEPSPKAVSSSTSKLSKSSSSSHGSKPIVPTQMIQSESNTLHEIYQYPPKGARSSNSSKSLSASTGSKEGASASAESLPTAASVSRLSSSSKSNSNGLGSDIAPIVAAVGPLGSMQPSGEDSNEVPHYNIGQSSTFVQDKSSSHHIETVHHVSNSITPKLNHPSDGATREQPRVPENRHLKRVAEESSDIQSSDFVMPLAAPNDNVPLHSNEYTPNNAVFDDELSVTSSLSSVVSKARVSFQITHTSSVVSALSDHHSREETKSRGSFRKSASDMIAERQSSKASVDNSREGNQLDSSTKSDVNFPSQSDEAIRNKRTETVRFHASRDSTEEVDARKPWRTASSKDCQANNDSSMFSEDVESAKLVTQAAIEESVSDEESAMSEVAKSKAALMSMGLYDDSIDERNTDAVRDEISVNPVLMLEQHGSKVQPKHLSRTSTASSITEWDFSDQNKGKKSDVLKPVLLETDPMEDIPYKASTSFSSEDTPSAPSLEDPSAPILSAAAMPIDTSSRSTKSKSSSKTQHLLDQQTMDPDPSNEEERTQGVKFAAKVANNSPDEIKQVESDESPFTEDKRERYRRSMLDAANEMSQRLEKSFLARSQQQTNDFESRSYEDLSSASEEDVVLAYLREEKNSAYDSPKSNELDVSENEPEEKPMTGSTVKSKASNLWSRLRQSVIKPPPSEAVVDEKLNSSIAAVSDSEYVVAKITPIFPGSERSSGVRLDDSDVESGIIVTTKGGDDESTDSTQEEDPNAKSKATILWARLRSSLGRLYAVTEEIMIEGKRAEDSDASALGSEHVHILADNSEEDGGEADQDEPAKTWYLDKEFYKSKYFLIAASCFLFILIVAISVGARKNGSPPLLQPTTAPMPLPESLSPSLQSPSVWVQGEFLSFYQLFYTARP